MMPILANLPDASGRFSLEDSEDRHVIRTQAVAILAA